MLAMLACGAGCATPPVPAPTTAPVYASLDDSVTAVEEAYLNIRTRHRDRERSGMIGSEMRQTTAATTRAVADAIERAYRASESSDAAQVQLLCRRAIDHLRDYTRMIGVNPNVLHELED